MKIKLKQQLKAGVKLGCILCGQPRHKSLNTFKDLLIEGIDLNTLARLTESEEYRFDKKILTPAHLDRLLNDLHQRFFQWRCQIRNFLIIKQFAESDRLIFYHSGNDTPEPISGLSYEKNKNKFLKLTEEIKNDININLKNLKELNSEENKQGEIKEKWFHYQNSVITFYGKTYKPSKESHAKFIRQLVSRNQKQNNNGTVLKEGERIPEKNLSIMISTTIKELRDIKKQLIRIFKEKQFPLKIDKNADGILLIYTI